VIFGLWVTVPCVVRHSLIEMAFLELVLLLSSGDRFVMIFVCNVGESGWNWTFIFPAVSISI
jgi:hypothetical protein